MSSVMSSATQQRQIAPGDRRWLVLAVVAIAQLMVVLDAMIVNIALPSAQHALGFANSDRQWVVTAYALAFGSLLPVSGRIGDMFSRKWVFIAGLAGFAVASPPITATRSHSPFRRPCSEPASCSPWFCCHPGVGLSSSMRQLSRPRLHCPAPRRLWPPRRQLRQRHRLRQLFLRPRPSRDSRRSPSPSAAAHR